MAQACGNCGKQEKKGAAQLVICSRCGAKYCSKKCQKSAWKGGHWLVCRSKGGSVAVRPTHTVFCTCVSCIAAASVGKIYRKKNGVETFMGIVPYHDPAGFVGLKKLDNPHDLTGPGHCMTNVEWTLECYHYDDPPTIRDSIPESHYTINFADSVRDINRFLVDFSDKPAYYKDSQDNASSARRVGNDDFFDVKYPFGSSKPLIRNMDLVKIVMYHPLGIPLTPEDAFGPQDPARNGKLSIVERFWVHVISVTSTGIVTGLATVSLDWGVFGIQRMDCVSFSVEKVLGMKKEENWN